MQFSEPRAGHVENNNVLSSTTDSPGANYKPFYSHARHDEDDTEAMDNIPSITKHQVKMRNTSKPIKVISSSKFLKKKIKTQTNTKEIRKNLKKLQRQLKLLLTKVRKLKIYFQ